MRSKRSAARCIATASVSAFLVSQPGLGSHQAWAQSRSAVGSLAPVAARGVPAASPPSLGSVARPDLVLGAGLPGLERAAAGASLAPSPAPSLPAPTLEAAVGAERSAAGFGPAAQGAQAAVAAVQARPAEAEAALAGLFEAVSGRAASAPPAPALGPSEPAPPAEPSGLAAAKPAPARVKAQPVTVTWPDGTVHPISYNPRQRRPFFLVRWWRAALGLPEQVRRIRRFARRVDASVNGEITDDNLWWSINRLAAMENQEGILRVNNRPLINAWDNAKALKDVSRADLAQSSLDDEAIMRVFKKAMDLEEPTIQYQFAFAQNLHPLIVRLAHFLGTTLQERVLVVALKGRQVNMSIWSDEEERHGPILEKLYERVQDPERPGLTQQGEAPRLPRVERTAKLALSNMGNRALAEMGAAAAYLTVRANAQAGSPLERAMEGIYRDEVYHYAIMQLVSKWALGQHSRFARLYRLLRHDLDYRVPPATDRVVHRGLMPPLLLLEVIYVVNALDKRVDRFLRSIPEAKARAIVGPANVTDEAVAAAARRRENTVTLHARMEQNPDLTAKEVQTLSERFPGWIDASERALRASWIREVLSNYRRHSLAKPEYWMRKKGFAKARQEGVRVVLERALEEEKGKFLVLDFAGPVADPVLRIEDREAGTRVLWQESLDRMSMLQIGAVMEAETLGVLKELEEKREDLSYAELVRRLNKSSTYQAAPIPLIDDL
ncbi:MAG: hypothetical protein HY554_08775 [Elusimicrobia bacterium]|nr:hypothetical protein [Elusimicrobiota bacterium]